MYKKILFATDGSEHSKRAAVQAITIAKCSKNSSIDVVYVIDNNQAKTEALNNSNSPDLNNSRKKRMTFFEKQAQEAEVKYQINILHGEPGPTIVNHANENDFQIVVIGSRGLNSLQELMLGSVSHKVAKRANCPVLIVK